MRTYLSNMTGTICILSLTFCLITSRIYAQEETSELLSSETNNQESKKKTSELDLYSGFSMAYDNNVYRLSDSQKDSYNEDDPRDEVSGRYDDMSSLSDKVIQPEVGIKFKTKSLFGKKLQISSRLKYNYYTANKKSCFPEARLRLGHSVFKNGILSFEGNFEYGYFKKNYLTGAEDISEANIGRSERIYSSAVYDEYEGMLGYEYRILDKKNDMVITGLSVQPFIGNRYKIYNSAFSNRDQNFIYGGLSVSSEFFSRLGFNAVYTYGRITSPGDEELVLFDEEIAGLDVNNDGELHDNAPFITKIDRSADRHIIEIEPSFKFTDNFLFTFALKIMRTKYSTDNTLDIERYTQKKDYWRIKTGLEYQFSKSLTAEIEYSHTEENDVEDGKYKRNVFTAGAKYYFL